MSPDTNTTNTKLCPVCGTRLNESAERCLVCGTELGEIGENKKNADVRVKRLPEIKLSLPAALGLLALFLTLGAVVIFLILKPSDTADIEMGDTTPLVGSATPSPTITLTPTVTLTATQAPTWTPLPPLEYTVNAGDSCVDVAAFFGVSVQSIILENNLSADCVLFEGQPLLIPQPTPTASPQPTSTLSEAEKTEVACETINYTVVENDTLSFIADTYDVSMATIRDYNALLNDTVFEGQTLIIPLCLREPTPGPTPTATPLPPYPGPNLLLPADGDSFMGEAASITLQWASVGELDANEAYAVTITDLTSEDNRTITEYVTNTSFIVPGSFLLEHDQPHIFSWSVYIVRQVGTEEDVENWISAGDSSEERVFSWFNPSTGSSTNN